MESILTTIKKLLGIAEEDDSFDTDVILHINSTFMILNQLGVGPSEGFMIEDESATWADFVPDGISIEAVKSYIYLRVKLFFDSNTTPSAVIEAMNRTIAELEWRLNVAVESTQSN